MPDAGPIGDGAERPWPFEGAGALLLACAARLHAYRARFRIQADN